MTKMITTSMLAPKSRPGQWKKGAWQRLSVALLFMVLTASTAWAQGYDYIAADGTVHNTADEGITPEILNGSTGACNLGVEDQTTWYVVSHSIGYEDVINCQGTVNIILVDGMTMSVTKNGRFYGMSSTLNIYGQAKGTGKLSINTADGHDGILCDHVVINGGTVECTAESDGQSSISGKSSLTINGGTVTATASDTPDGMGLSSLGNVTINGGKVTATGGVGIYSSLGTITLGSSHADDFIYASSYWSGIGSIAIKDGQTLAANDVEIYKGSLSSNQRDAIAGKTLKLVEWAGTGAETDPYLIKIPAELNLLALRVNDGDSDYSGKYFQLSQTISFAHKTDGTEGADTENNFTAIGSNSHPFKGHFDGKDQNCTISGIRIYKSGSDDADKFQGLFGRIGEGADIHHVTLIDARITGHSYTGGIVGSNSLGNVSNCHVASDVTIHAVKSDAIYHGGIVGFNGGSNNAGTGFVSNCTSAATLTLANAGSGNYYGGVVGYNVGGTLSHNLAIGAVVPATEDNYYGAICGNNGGTLQNNYYHACTVAGVQNATTVGCNSTDVIDGNGAVPAYLVTLGEGVTLQADLTDAQGFSYHGESGGEPGYYCHAGAELTLNALPTEHPSLGYQYAYTVNSDIVDGTTVTVPASATTVAIASKPIDWTTVSSGDSWASAYIIYNKDQLNLLAQRVNDAKGDAFAADGYKDKYFKLGQNVTYDHETAWNDENSKENNYTAIGYVDGSILRYFKGHFDGASCTISGIRLYSGEKYQGIFAVTYGAEVKGITLDDARITGYDYTGGIVGTNSNDSNDGTVGTVSDCHVTATVAIHTDQDNAYFHGGIVGRNYGTISNCTSAATLTRKEGLSNGECYGGIAGENWIDATLSGNLAIGAVVPVANETTYGAICGYNEAGILQNNYYRDCKVASNDVTVSGVGCGNMDDGQGGFTVADVAENNGAMPGFTLSLPDGVTTTSTPITYHKVSYYAGTITLIGGLPSTTTPAGYYYAYLVNGKVLNGDSFKLDADATVVADAENLYPVDWAFVNEGSDADPYMIYNKDQLNMLAQRVNDGTGDDFAATGYKDKFFRLGADIEYSHDTDWDAATSKENNYTTVGYYQSTTSNRYFNGNFDGQGHTVSGIRIYKSSNASDYTVRCQGLFGYTESSANIHDVILADTRITGYDNTGGIVGKNSGTVSHCYVANTVAIHADMLDAWNYGGIVGENKGTVSDCISAVTLTKSIYDTQNYGGIAGDNNSGTLRRNIVIGAVVPAATNSAHGAICGRNNNGILQSNYYHACTVADVENATNAGCGKIDNSTADVTTMTDPNNTEVTYTDCAVSSLRDGANNSTALGLLAQIATAGPNGTPLDLGWSAGKYPMQLADRTLYKDGAWNTLCLPFAIANIEAEGCPLNGATVLELNDASISGTTLTLNFKTVTKAIAAGVPYIVKWETTGDNITSPVFQGVTIDATDNSYDNKAGGDTNVRFIGTYDQKTIANEDKSILFLGAANTLYYPSGKGSVNIGACRAYFKIGDGNALARQLTAFNFGFDDEGETTGIIEAEANSSLFTLHSSLPGWFSLDGRRLNGKPTKKGLYIVNGRKVVMK